jgi:hypothetical protein
VTTECGESSADLSTELAFILVGDSTIAESISSVGATEGMVKLPDNSVQRWLG